MGFFSDLGNKVSNGGSTGVTTAPTAYQKNVQSFVQKKQEPDTTRSVLAKIFRVYDRDPEKAKIYFSQLQWEMDQPESEFYNPYTKSTNQAVANLAAYGIDTSNIDDNWFEANSWLKQYYQYTANTNSVKSPGKRASAEEKAAYQFNQIWMAEEQTKKAETEWAALQEELSYWANRTDRNYSDDEIIDRIDWSKYKTLQKMDETRMQGTPMELNRAVGYSKDAMHGTLWAARNNGGTGDMWSDIANSGLNTGNVWKYDPNIAEKLDPSSEKFSPYSVGSTNIDDAAVYFGVSTFGKNWLQEHNGMQWSNDETEKKLYQKVLAAEENQSKAEEELAKLNAWVDKRLKTGTDPEKILSRINWSDYPTLAAMDKSIGKDGQPGTGDLVSLTRGLDYRYADLKQRVYDQCAANQEKGNGDKFAASVSASVASDVNAAKSENPENAVGDVDTVTGAAPVYKPTEQQLATTQEQDQIITDAAEILPDVTTPAEQKVLDNAYSVTYDNVKSIWEGIKQVGAAIKSEFIQKAISNSVSKTASSVLNGADVIASFEQNQKYIDEMQARSQEIVDQIGNLIYYGKDASDFGDTYFEFDGNNIKLNMRYDQTAGKYVPNGIINLTTGSEDLSNFDHDKLQARVNGILSAATDHRSGVLEANSTEITEEQKSLVDEYNKIQTQIDSIEQNQDYEAYDQAIKDRTDAEKVRTATIKMLEDAGVSNEELQDFENTNAVIDAIRGFTEYDPTVWMAYNAYDLYATEYLFDGSYAEVFEAAKEGDAKTQEEIEVAKWMLDYADRMGIEIPDNVRNNMERYIAKMERNHQDYEYFALVGNDDFKSEAEKGRKIFEDGEQFDWKAYSEAGSVEGLPLWDTLNEAQKQTLLKEDENYKNEYTGPETLVNMYENMAAGMRLEGRMYGLAMTDYLLTDYEKDTYYYLLSTQGVDAAEQYYSHLSDNYGVLSKRYTEVLQEGATELADQGFLGRRAADVISMIMAPAAAIGSLAYGIDQGIKKLTGQETEYNPNDPMLSFNNFRTSAREEIQREITREYGEGTFLQKVASGLSEMVSNRGDSIMNMLAFGWLTGGIPNEMVKEFAGAIPMATSAAFDAMSEAKEKGATEEQLWAIGGVTLFAESITEAISISNINDAFGIGQDITGDTVKAFLKNWFTKEGISEAFGESLNYIIENFADEKIMGELSDHSQKVKEYIASGMSEEDAEAAARRDELSGILHTALISYLSPGLDIVQVGAGRLNYYRNQTQYAQEHGANVSLIDVMKADKGIRDRVDAGYESLVPAEEQRTQAVVTHEETEQATEQAAAPEQEAANIVEPDTVEGEATTQEEAPVQGDIEVVNAPKEGESTAASGNDNGVIEGIALDYAALDAARDADQSSQTATIASVLDISGSDTSSDMANAAAANLDVLSDGMPVDLLQDLLLGANETGTDGNLVKQALTVAALSESSEAYQMMQSSEYIHADIDQRAAMLASTVDADAANADVQSEVAKSVHEYRVAKAELEILLNGGLNEAQKAQEAADAAAQETYSAQEELDARQADLEAKQDNLLTVNEEFQQDPADHAKADQVTRALNEVQKSSEVEQEYQQQLDNAKERQQKAEENAKRIKRNAMMAIRQQAEAVVADQNRQRQERQAQEEQIRQQKAEEEAQQKQAQEETDNAVNADAEAFIEQNYADATDEEKQKIRDAFAKIQAEAPLTRSMDDNGQMTLEAIQRRDKFIKQVAKKFGVQIDILDTTQGGKVDRQNGYVDLKNNRIVLDNTATMDDAMFFVLGHELTHIAEKSGTYDDLAGALLRMRYGTDDMRLAADIRARKALYDDRLARMHEQDNSIDATPLTEEQAAQEIVADIMGDLIRGDEELANRLVAEEPGIARRILDSIKSFIKKAVGMKGAWLSNAQKTVDMLESALTEATSGTQESQKKYYISESDAQAIQDQYPSSSVKVQQYQTPQQIETVESYLGAVDNDVLEAAMTYQEDRNAPFKRISVADVSDREAADLNRMFGIDVTGYRHDIDRNFFNHVEERHGENGSQDHSMADLNDVARVGWVIENYDNIVELPGEASYNYMDDENKPMPLIRYEKQIDGTLYAVEAVGENKWGKLHVVSAYMQKNNPANIASPDTAVTQVPRADNGLGHNVQNALASPAKESVTQDAPGVKPLVTDDQGNDLATELPGGTVLVDPPTKYSLSSFNDKEQAEVRQALIRSGNFTPEQVDKYLDNALGLASMIAADKLRLDYTVTDPNKTMVKPNADYGASIDASTLCAKRLLYQGTFDAIQHALPNTPLLPEDLINLSNMMREMGYETPCGICYVESRRRNLGKYTEEWLKNYKGEYVPTVADVTTSDGLEKLRKNHKQAYDDFMKAMNSHGNQNNPKPVQLRTDYRGEIRDLTDDAVQSAINHGGLRLQSFSDFETPHLLDMVQVVMDMASKGLTSQAYTKVPNFAWVFGDTGIKINLSLIGKGTGLDENGKLVFDDVEGMPIAQAVALRNRYSKNVGTVLVGINDDHIKAAMADDRIDYIIPFHRSGWTKEDRKLMTVIADYKDYTLSQNEKDIKTGKKAEKNLEPVGEKTERGDGYWEFDKSGKENAEKYLELCKKNGIIPKFSQFLVDNGDGSYSLQPDGSTDGYWKLLIDFKMYDNDGNGSEQTAVTPNINMDQAMRVLNDYSLDRNGIKMADNNSLPVAQPVVDRYVEEYKAQHPLDETRTKYSLPSQEVEEAAEKAFPNTKARTPDGKLMPLYHGTSADFTVFDTSISGGKNGTQEGYGIYLTDNAEIPKQYGGRTISAYVDMERPAYDDKKTFKRTELAKVIKAACEKEAQQFVDEGSYDNVKAAVRDTWISNYVYTPEYRTIDEAYKAVADMILDQNDSDSEIISELLIGQGIRDYGRAMDFYHNILTPLTGFDGIWAHWTNRNTGENANVLLAFDSSQIKSNEPVTYDDNGDPIPMDQRFDKSNPDIRYSLPEDAPYMAAVERGEMDEAQKYVDNYAAENGYTKLVHHGTGEHFTVFNRGAEGIHLGNEAQANQVASMRYDERSKQTEYVWNNIRDSVSNMTEGQRQSLVTSAENLRNDITGGENLPAFTGDINDTDAVISYVDDMVNRYEEDTWETDTKLRMQTFDRDTGRNVMHLYSKITNPFTINGDIRVWSPVNIADVVLVRADGITEQEVYSTPVDISGSDIVLTDQQRGTLEQIKSGAIEGDAAWDALSDVLGESGFNGIKYLNTFEGDQNSYSYIALKQSDVKSADTVTYDDQGKVIPLSERFNSQSNDIRYSLPSDNLLEQQIRNYLSRGGSLSTNTVPPTDNELGFPGQQPQRQFGSRTAQQSNALHDEVKDYLYNHSSYTPDSNQAQINRAIDWVRSHANQIDQEGYYGALDDVTADNFDYRSADGQARMLTVMSMAALKVENAETEAERRAALADELRLADAFNKQGTDLGRQLQARKIFRLMTPIGRQAALQRQADAINDDYARRGIETRVRLSDDVLQAAENAQTEEDFDNVRKRANKELADQMPANWKDKLRGWRMLSMLGNPRTHIRNIIGNAMFIPAVGLKNKLGALGEAAFTKGERTKTLAPILSKDIRDFARQDALAMKDELTGEAKYNEQTQVEQERKTFGRFLQAVSDFNSNALEAEDWFFLKGHYRRALGGWMQANGYTPEQLQHFPYLLEQGREYAIQEAQKATYRDFSKLASTLNQVSRGGGLTGFLVDATLPFKKTPANILKRGMEYSPAGIVKSLTADVYHLKQYNDYMNKLAKGDKKAVLPDKAISPSQFIDKLCSGLSGTAVMALGFLLANSGAVTVGLDDDEDKLEKEQGNQEYAIKVNLFGNDVTFTMDWAAPMSMPFFVGAAIQNQMEKEGDFDVQSVLDAFGNITEPVFNLSMLDGVNSLFKTSQYDDTNTITQIGAKIASNYATSYVPSLMGAIARTVDGTRRKNFVEQGKGTGVLGTFRYAKEQVENKIPGLSQSNIPYRDVWGNAETSGLAERILENFILPGYISDYKNDPILNEMARLYEETGDSGMIPKDPDKSITVNKEKRVLTAEQWDAFKAARGQAAYNGLTDLMSSDDYKNASSTVQAQMVNGVWEYATQVGKNAVFPDYNMKDYGSNPVQTVAKDSTVTSNKNEMIKALKAGDLDTYDTMVEALRSEDVEDTEIKRKISDTFRDEYKTAYLNGNYTRMAEIETMLDDSGFDFDLESWEEQADKKRKP